MTISVLTREYLRTKVTFTVDGDAADPTGLEVMFAFPEVGTSPQPEDFIAGSWITTNGEYRARALVGEGGEHELPVGDYQCWIKIADNPEEIVREIDILRVR